MGFWEKQGRSLSFVKTASRLHLTQHHFVTVDNALRSVKTAANNSIINHAITRNCELTLQLLYTHYEYLRSILSEMFQQRPLQIVDKAQDSLQFQEILRLGTYEAVCDHMVDRVFRKLQNESRSTNRLIERILARTDAKMDAGILEDATWYIEIRRLIVHNPSIIDQQFEKKYSHKFKYVKSGNKLSINVGMAKRGINAVQKLCAAIDHELGSRGYIELTSKGG